MVTGSLLLALGSATAQTPVPDTPAGRALSGWIAAFDSGDPAAYREFVQRAWPLGAQYLDRDRAFRAETGGFDLRKIDPSSTPTRLVALVQERNSDQIAQLVLTVEDAEPHHILELVLRAIPRPAELALPHLSMNALLPALRERLQRDVAADRFSGAVLIAQNGTPVFAQAYGLADRDRTIPNALDTRFRIGSMNKMFTAVATLQLVQAGKLRLDAPVGTYLTDYPNHDVASKVTIRQLLSHTGGTGDIFGPDFAAHRRELRTPADYIALYGTRGPLFEPGSRFAYSNYGFVLLGRVIETVSGEDYYAYVQKHIYAPAGMTSSGSEPEDRRVARRSVGYTSGDDGVLRPNTDSLPYRGSPAGGGYTTVGDLLRFANALDAHRLLDPASTRALTTGTVEMPGGARYAFGMAERTVNGTRCFGHNGGAPGMNGDLEVCGPNHTVVIVLANRDPNIADSIAGFITNRLP